MAKKKSKLSKNEKAAAKLGISLSAYKNLGKSSEKESSSSSGPKGSAPSGYSYTDDTKSKLMTGDAQKVLEGADPAAQQYILQQDFGNDLSSGEAKKFLNKWIDAGKPSSGASGSYIPGGVLPASMQNLAVTNLPPEAFKQLVPQLVPGTPEYQAAIDKINVAYFDVLQQQMNANTEQEKASADYNWQNLKSAIETNLNTTLSNDSFQAWDQVQSLKNQFGQQNIEGSGLQNEAIDSYLNKVRRNDVLSRTDSQNKQEESQQNYYMKFATPAQIKALTETNPEKAKAWGLMPSDEVKNAMNPVALKAKYPNMSDADIQQNIATMLDANGNYRSNLYQKYMTGGNRSVDAGNVSTKTDNYGNIVNELVTPSDYGFMDINKAKTQFQTDTIENQHNLAAAEAARNLGSTQPTKGSDSGVDTTLFNKINPDPNTDPDKKLKPVTLNNPINVPGSMLSSAS